MIVVACFFCNLENLLEELKLPFRVEEGIRLVKQRDAIVILE
jgi:hypothetical protein